MTFWPVKKVTLRQVDAIGAVLCLVASLAVYCAVLNPIIEQRAFLADQRETLESQRDESSRLSASMLALSDQLSAAQEELAQSSVRLESSDRMNQRLAVLTALFTECSLDVDDIQAGKISTGSAWNVVPIAITGGGHYAQCVMLLDRLQQTFVDMSVTRFRLARDPAQFEHPGSFSIQIIWYTAPGIETL